MNTNYVSFLIVITLSFCSYGCASTNSLNAQVTMLEENNVKQKQQIADLQSQVSQVTFDNVKCNAEHVGNDLGHDAIDLASAAWSWSSKKAEAAYADVAERANRCYKMENNNLHNLEDAKALAIRCWQNSSHGP